MGGTNMTEIRYENGCFNFFYNNNFMSSHPTLKSAKQSERRFLKLLETERLEHESQGLSLVPKTTEIVWDEIGSHKLGLRID